MTESVDKSTLTTSGLAPVPTTRILATGHLASPLAPEQRHTIRFELFPIGPLAPLHALLHEPDATHQ